MIKLKELRKRKKIKAKELAKAINVSESAISLYENGKREPDSQTLLKIANFINVSIDELLGNELEKTSLPKGVFPIQKKKFRMLGEIACGKPIFADEDHETYISASASIDADFCLTAKGDSMIGARIHDGDIVFIKEMDIVDNGQIAAVVIEDEVTLKRWYYDRANGELILSAENSAYKPLVYRGEILNQIRCLGKAVCFMSNL